tara:strand:+ start:694 stop:1128 length:435 start_codon:yes stop_codon:yes gene_type:complete
MRSLLFLGILIFIYYQINKWYPFEISWNHHLYFYGFIGIYLFIYYLMNYHQPFVYKMMKNVQETHNKPLYDIDSLRYKENQTQGLKYNLAMKQGWRCMNCQNPILQQDITKHNINYMKPLEFGGENNIDNLGLKCQTCSTFSPF